MSAALIAAGGLMGLASSPHCAAMCGAPCAAIARACGPARPLHTLAAWHAGRVLAYAAAGSLAAASVGFLAGAAGASAVLTPLWTLMQAAVLVMGLALLWQGRMPRWLDAAAQHIGRALQPMQAQPTQSIIAFAPTGMRRAALAGLAWVALPCGVLYAALAVAALADGPLLGAAVMAAFALGSAIGLVGAPMLWQRLAGMERAGSLRLAGALLVLGAGWALWHGLGEAFGMWCRSLV